MEALFGHTDDTDNTDLFLQNEVEEIDVPLFLSRGGMFLEKVVDSEVDVI
jgi:hypothetical protein